MLWFTADIGTWERGRVIRFKAKSHRVALRRAYKIAKRLEKEGVVQLRTCGIKHPSKAYLGQGHAIWDEMNGWYGESHLKRIHNNFKR